MGAISATLLIASVLFRETPAAGPGATTTTSTNAPAASEPAPSPAVAAAQDDPAPSSSASADEGEVPEDLRPTSAPPWNPPRAVPRRRAWEYAILLPQRVVTLPLSGVGIVMDRALVRFEKTSLFGKLATMERPGTGGRRPPRPPKTLGFSVEPARLGDRTGLGGRFEARVPVFRGRWKQLLVGSHAASTRHYHETRAGLEGDLGSLVYEYAWRPEEQFYGLGMETDEDDRTSYAVQTEQVRLGLHYDWNRREDGSPRSRLTVWAGPENHITRRGRQSGIPSIEEEFPLVVANTFDHRREQLVYGVRLANDWRRGTPHLHAGWRVLLDVERHDEPRGSIALRKENDPGAQYTRTTVEFETMVSFMRDPRTIRLMTRVVDLAVSGGADRLEVHELSALGGHYGLGGFNPGRFHDLDLVHARLMYIFPLVRRLEFEIHGETGGTFSDVWETTRLDQLAFSYGFSLRGRTTTRPVGSIGLDFSREAVRLRWWLLRHE